MFLCYVKKNVEGRISVCRWIVCEKQARHSQCARPGEGRLLCGMYFIVELKGSSEISVLAVVFLPSPLSGCLVRFLEHCGGIQTLLSSFLMIWDLMRRIGLAALDLNLAFNEQKRDSTRFPYCSAQRDITYDSGGSNGVTLMLLPRPPEASFFCTLLHKASFGCFLRSKPEDIL